jgi:hypothetical protein
MNFKACSLALWEQSPPLKSIVICCGRSKQGSILMAGLSHDCPVTLLFPEIMQSAFSVRLQGSEGVGAASGGALGDRVDKGAAVSWDVGTATGTTTGTGASVVGGETGDLVGAFDVGSDTGDTVGELVSTGTATGTGASVVGSGNTTGDWVGAVVSLGDPVGIDVSFGSETGDAVGELVSTGTATGAGATGVGLGGVGGAGLGGSGEITKLYSSSASQDSPTGCGSASILTLAEKSPPTQTSISRFGLRVADSPTLIGLDSSISTKLNVSLSRVKSTADTFMGTVPMLLISNV